VIVVVQDQTWVLKLLETAQRDTPTCAACYGPTTPVARGDALWLECSTVQRPRPLIRRLLDPASVHTRRLLLEDLEPAA
jgi:hypothetical protein